MNNVKEYAAKAVSGLTVASVVWIYATFATKSDMDEVKKANANQWHEITELKADARANDAIIKYYFQPNYRTNN